MNIGVEDGVTVPPESMRAITEKVIFEPLTVT